MSDLSRDAKTNGLKRREFLAGTSAAVVGATLCSGCAMFTSQATPDLTIGAKKGVMLLNEASSRKLSQPGRFVRVVSPDQNIRVIVFRRTNGALVATDMACTHWGSDVDFDVEKQRLVCPSHGSKFDVDGKVIEGPADTALRTHRVDEVDGLIRLTLSV